MHEEHGRFLPHKQVYEWTNDTTQGQLSERTRQTNLSHLSLLFLQGLQFSACRGRFADILPLVPTVGDSGSVMIGCLEKNSVPQKREKHHIMLRSTRELAKFDKRVWCFDPKNVELSA